MPAESLDFSDKMIRSVIQLKNVISDGRKNRLRVRVWYVLFFGKKSKKIYVFVFFSIVCAFFSVTGNKLETKQVDRSKVVAHHATTRWLVSISVCRIFCIMYAFKFNLVIKVAVSRFVRRLRKGDWHREYWRCVIWQWLVMFAHPSSRAKHDAKQPRKVLILRIGNVDTSGGCSERKFTPRVCWYWCKI